MMTDMDDATQLPTAYEYCKIGPGTYRANLLSEEDVDKWLEEFTSITNTNWRICKSLKNSAHYICSLEYNCHHSSHHRVEPTKNARGKSKNWNCRAKLKISIKHTTRDTKKKDKFVKEGMPAFIEIQNIHSHSLISEESLGYLRPSRKVREDFYSYFDNGLGIAESLEFHKSQLESKYGAESAELLANASLNPKYRTVYFWYNQWKNLKLGPQDELEKMRDEFYTYFDSGLGATESLQCHKSQLELKYGVGSVELDNTSLNPKYRTVCFWYNQWKNSKLGPQHGDGVLEEAPTIANTNTNNAVRVKEEPDQENSMDIFTENITDIINSDQSMEPPPLSFKRRASSETSSSNKRKRYEDTQEDLILNAIRKLEENSNRPSQTAQEDCYDYFGKYISSMLRMIGPPDAMRLQEQMTSLITRDPFWSRSSNSKTNNVSTSHSAPSDECEDQQHS